MASVRNDLNQLPIVARKVCAAILDQPASMHSECIENITHAFRDDENMYYSVTRNEIIDLARSVRGLLFQSSNVNQYKFMSKFLLLLSNDFELRLKDVFVFFLRATPEAQFIFFMLVIHNGELQYKHLITDLLLKTNSIMRKHGTELGFVSSWEFSELYSKKNSIFPDKLNKITNILEKYMENQKPNLFNLMMTLIHSIDRDVDAAWVHTRYPAPEVFIRALTVFQQNSDELVMGILDHAPSMDKMLPHLDSVCDDITAAKFANTSRMYHLPKRKREEQEEITGIKMQDNKRLKAEDGSPKTPQTPKCDF